MIREFHPKFQELKALQKEINKIEDPGRFLLPNVCHVVSCHGGGLWSQGANETLLHFLMDFIAL